MAKQLPAQPTSSPIARLFDMQTAASAVAAAPVVPKAQPAKEPGAVPAPPPVSNQDGPATDARWATVSRPPTAALRFIKRELVLTPETDEAFTRLIELYRRTTGARLSASHVARAILRAVAFAMPAVEHEAARLGPMKLPSNARGRAIERERFEARLADALLAGLIRCGKESEG
ncbi:MAG: hypothetical protein IT435_04395 [Phycisphaerales bacterium]|nr:hypothetical protein [Phycisphaerales bacterium]